LAVDSEQAQPWHDRARRTKPFSGARDLDEPLHFVEIADPDEAN
jgi:hypothetical protein